jgi:lauroyl/myristoyl acyltransferase
VSTDQRYWTKFLGQDTAFYVGAEQIARAMRMPILYAHVRRVRRSYYEVEFLPLWDGREAMDANQVTERMPAPAKKPCSRVLRIGSGPTDVGG